jgi:hypothetical protein
MKIRTLAIQIFLVLIIAAVTTGGAAPQRGGAPNRTVTMEQYERWKTELSNWGRWGKDDELGTINLITPAKRKHAAALVKEGFSVSLASTPDTVKSVDNPSPYDRGSGGNFC